jgi:HEAT repeat protein
LLVKAISDPDSFVQSSGVAAIEHAGAQASGAVPGLSALLSSPSPGVRDHAADALAAIGPDAAPALPALRALLSDGGPLASGERGEELRRSVENAIRQIEAAPSLP